MHLYESGEYSLDANVVVDFYKTDNLLLLSRLLPRRLLMSDFVAAELAEAGIYFPEPAIISFDCDEAWKLFGNIRSAACRLGIGEIAAIVVAKLYGAGVITNDSRARKTAQSLAVQAIGSIGLLEDAVDLAFLPAETAYAVLEGMIAAGAWISNELLVKFRDRLKIPGL